jgi:hypothetical protein
MAMESKSFAEFLVEVPPYTEIHIAEFRDPPPHCQVLLPKISIYCETCEGPRVFQPRANKYARVDGTMDLFLSYVCRNCGKQLKHFSIVATAKGENEDAVVMKLGELPPFGPHTPPRMLRFIQPDIDLFLKGRRAESQGMGIGAFAYYRRVVENQKNRVIDEIIKVSTRLRAEPGFIASLEAAKKEIQFSGTIEKIKDGLPETLKIEGHNPLTLLHNALSIGIHSSSEEECLELAQNIRVVLTELAERIDRALQDHAELKQAVGRLVQAKAKPKIEVAPQPEIKSSGE